MGMEEPGGSPALGATVAFGITTIAVASVYMTQPILPELGRAFAVPPATARGAFGIASGIYAFSFFVFGPLADRFNRVLLARVGLLMVALAVVAAAFVKSFGAFLLCMACVGISASSVPAAMFPHMAKMAPKGRTGTYLGLILSGSIVGVVLGRSLIGIITHSWDYRVAFGVLASACVCGALATVLIPNQPAEPANSRVASAYAVALRMLASPEMLRSLLVGMALFIGYLGSITFLTLRLAGPPFHYSSATIGWLSFLGLSAVLGAPIAGSMTNRYGLRSMIAAGMSLTLVGLGLLAGRSGPLIGVGMTVLYLGVFATQPAMLVLVTSQAPPNAIGRASALYLLASLAGGSSGTWLLGPVWRAQGWAGIIAACYGALCVSFALGVYQTSRYAARVRDAGRT
jgi:YNFM family putative membrane transporter